MNEKLINNIIDLLLENDLEEIDIIKKQKDELQIDYIENSSNNKYITFKINKEVEKINTEILNTISVMFWDLKQVIPFDCILHLKNGYIHSLEIYSCDGNLFENIHIDNIDIRDREPNFSDACKI